CDSSMQTRALAGNVGYSMEQLRALTPVDLKPAFDQASFERLLAPLLRGETSLLVFETEHRRADGTRYPVEVHLQLAMRPQRRVVLAVILDVSARQAAEHETQELSAELTAQGQRFRSLIEDSTDLIALVSADGLIQYLNPAFGTILEHDPEGWIGENLLDLVWPDDRQAAVALLARGLRTPGEGIPWQLRVRHADGAFRWLEGTGTNHLDDPATHGIVINCRDVTARRQSEDVLRENEQRLRVAIDTANLTLFEMDTDLRYTWIYNPQLGYSSDAQIGRTDQELLGDEGLPIMAVKRRALESGQRVREEVTIRQGRVDVTLDLTVEPKRTAAGRVDGVRGASLDVSRFKALQALLVQAQKLETVGQLVGGVAHDYNNMLSVILMNVTHALTVVDPSSPIRADLEDIHQASRRSADLTRQLLAFARKQPVAPKVLDLNQTVSSTCSMLRRIIGEDIVLDWRPGADVAPVNVDPAQLEQVLLNLCLNAQDAIVDVGTVTIATTNVTLDEAYCADHPGSAPGRYVLLTVSDDGTGMDRATLDRIFEPFFTTKEVGRGTGMGLATTYGIAKQNNGFLTASSALGRGTTVGLYLPQAEAEIAGTPLERPATGLRSHGETVLVVEDEEAVLRGTRRLLTDLGYTVLAADTPTKALRVAAEHTGAIHLLLTDLVMPEMNGVDLAGQLKARHPDLKCMLMSAHPAEAHALGPARETIMSVIQKPFTQEALGAAVRAALGGPGLHDLAHP
ncbi:MAG: PAS domain S-box protein, partial [Gemmatimonadota bacterium]|nr:PAS domain S-box protein [Gemmatimonadota bacterium]